MNEPNITELKQQGWGNCPGCGYFYKQSALEHCPMCRHSWRVPKSYTQPEYEGPGLG